MKTSVVVTLVVGFVLITGAGVSRSAAQAPLPPPSAPRDRVLARLDQADTDARQAITAAIAPIDRLFDRARQNTPALAESVLGWAGRWRLVADQVPYAGSGRHEAFLRDEFHRLMLSTDALEAEVRQAVESDLQAEHDIEDRLLVRLRQDLPDLPAPEIGPAIKARAVQAHLDEALVETTGHAVAALREAVVREMVVWVTSEILARQAARLALPASLTASGTVSFGLGLGAGLAVDQALAWTWDRWSDPTGRLVPMLNTRLEDLRRQVIEGTTQAPGLKPRLMSVARERAERRRAVILREVETMGGAP
jgi:hypothetical protein